MTVSDYFQLAGHVLDGRHRVDHVVGEGGFGVVYKGFHLAFAQTVAIKCLKTPAHFTEEGQAIFIAKFREEAQLLARLSQHPSIVRVYDFNTVQTPRGIAAPYMVLEWLDGEPLDAWLAARRGQRLSEVDALGLLRPAIEALAFAHRQNVAHRDVKPANLFVVVGPQGRSTKVLDFGIAKAMQEGETATQLRTHTSSGFSAFSPGYGAPEQFRPKKFGPTGPWTDVHALALILVELVTGRPALEGEDQGELFAASTDGVRPTPSARGGSVSQAFEAVCARALACAAADRYRDASELLAALDAAVAAGFVVAERRSVPDPSGVTVLPAPTRAPSVAPSAPPMASDRVPVMPPPMPGAPGAPHGTQLAAPGTLAHAMHPAPAPPGPWGQPPSTTAPVFAPQGPAPQFGPPPGPAGARRGGAGPALGVVAGVVLLGGIGIAAVALRTSHEPSVAASASASATTAFEPPAPALQPVVAADAVDASVAAAPEASVAPSEADDRRRAWIAGPLLGNDNTVAAMKGARISGEGPYSIHIVNQMGFTCSLEFGADGRPARLYGCSSSQGWRLGRTSVTLRCTVNKQTKYEVCSGSTGGMGSGSYFGTDFDGLSIARKL